MTNQSSTKPAQPASQQSPADTTKPAADAPVKNQSNPPVTGTKPAADEPKPPKELKKSKAKPAACEPDCDLEERLAQQDGCIRVDEGDLIVFEIGRGWRLAKVDKHQEKIERLTKQVTILAKAIEPFSYDAEELKKYHLPKFQILKRFTTS